MYVYIYVYEQLYQWHNTEIGNNATFHIHVKSEHGYSPKYPEHVFSVIEVNIPRHGFDKKLWQITNCDGMNCWLVAICDGSKYNFSDWCQLCQRVYS